MKKYLITFLLLSSIAGYSQNVGIGNPAPASRLEVNNNSSVRPSIGIVDSAAGGLGNIRFKNSVRTSRNMEFSALTFSAYAKDSYLDVRSDSVIIATFRGDGNFGVGTLSPNERMHINGNINITGAIKANGNAGTAGQVLTSNGAGAVSWHTAPSGYPANGRLMLMVNPTAFPGKVADSINLGTVVYNTFGAGVTIGTTTIVIEEAGLYEIQGHLFYDVGAVSVDNPIAPSNRYHPYGTMEMRADFGATTFTFPLIYEQIDKEAPGGTEQLICAKTMPYRWVGQLPAGVIITFVANISGYTLDTCCDPSPRVSQGYIGILRVN